MTPVEWISAGSAGLMTLLSVGGTLVSHGRSSNRIDEVAKDVDQLGARVKSVEDVKAEVQGLKSDIENFGRTLSDAQKLQTSELARVAERIDAGMRLMEQKLDANQRLNGRDIDEVKHSVRNIRQMLQGPAPQAVAAT